ncbi:MAG: arginine--tRNA ligase, partial [Desulfobulbaceae bacterium]
MIRSQLKKVLDACFDQGVAQGAWSAAGSGRFTVELPKHEGQGDFSTNMAMVLAGLEKTNPRQMAARIVELLQQESQLIDRLEVAGPGFVNIFIKPQVWRQVIP